MKKIQKLLLLIVVVIGTISIGGINFASTVPNFTDLDVGKGYTKTKTLISVDRENTVDHTMYYTITPSEASIPIIGDTLSPGAEFTNGDEYQIPLNEYFNIYNVNHSDNVISEFQSVQITAGLIQDKLVANFGKIIQNGAFGIDTSIAVDFPTQIRALNDGIMTSELIKDSIIFKLNDENGGDVSYSANFYFGDPNSYVYINPDSSLAYNQDYFIRVEAEIENVDDEAYIESEFTFTTQAPELTNGLSFDPVPFTILDSEIQLGALTDGSNKFVFTTEINTNDPIRYPVGYEADDWTDIVDGVIFNEVENLWVKVAEINPSNEIVQCSYARPVFNSSTDWLSLLNNQSVYENKIHIIAESIPGSTTLYYKIDANDEPGPLGYDSLVTSSSVVNFEDLTLFDHAGMDLVIAENDYLHVYALEQDGSSPQYYLKGYEQLKISAGMAGVAVPTISIVSAVPATAEGKTKITLDTTGVSGEIGYVVSSVSRERPSNNNSSPTGYAAMPGDGEIAVAQDEYIHFYGIDSNTVTGYGEQKILFSEINIASPYDTALTVTIENHEQLKFAYDVKIEIDVFYAIYPDGTDLTGISNEEVFNGSLYDGKLPITTNNFNETSTLAEEHLEKFTLSDQSNFLGSYEIAIATKVGGDYYASPVVSDFSNIEYRMNLTHKSGPITKTIPGLYSTAESLAPVQVIIEGDSSVKLKLDQDVGTDSGTVKSVVVMKRSLYQSKSRDEMITFLNTEGNYAQLVTDNELIVFVYDVGGEYDVSTLDPSIYTAFIRNADGGVYDGGISINPLTNAFIVLKAGPVALTVEPIFEGESANILVKFHGLVDVLDFSFTNFSMSPILYAKYNGTGSDVAIPLPSPNFCKYENDVIEQTTTIAFPYAKTKMIVEMGKEIKIEIDDYSLSFLNGNSLTSQLGNVIVSGPVNNITAASYLNDQELSFTNPTAIKMQYILVKSNLVDGFPTEAGNVDAYISNRSTQVSTAIAEPSATATFTLTNLEIGTYNLFGVPVDYIDNLYVSLKSDNVITIYQQTQSSSSSSSSSNNNDDDDPTPPTPTEPDAIDALNEATGGDDGDVNDQLNDFEEALGAIETPEEAEKSVGIIGEAIGNAGDNLEKLEEEEKEELVKNLSDIMKNTAGIIEKLDDKADKSELIGEIIASTQKVIEALENIEEKTSDKKLANNLNSSLVDLINKVIEQESKIVIKKDTLVMPSDIDEPLKKGEILKNKLQEKLEAAGIDQELKELKKTVLFKVEDGQTGLQGIGFHKDTIKKLAREVENIQLDFGNTGIQVNAKVMEQAKNNMYFTTEDLPKEEGDKKPEGHEGEDLQVRQVEAFEGQERVKAFEKPVKVSFELKDFIEGDIKDEDIASLVVMVQNETTGEWEPTGGNYDPATGMITFYRIHMSKYTVVKNKKKFSDVENSWAKDEINNLLGKGIADAKKEFRPTDSVTREEFAAWICRAYGLKEDGHTADFADIDKSNPYYKEITNASTQGLVLGRTATEFAPKEAITREEMATLVARAISNYNDVKVPNDGEQRFASLVEDEDTADWAVDSVAMMIDMGIMNTDDGGNFNPQDPISKEAAADIFAKLYK